MVRFHPGAHFFLNHMLRNSTHADLTAIKQLIDWGAGAGRVLPRSQEELEGVIDTFFVWEDDGKIIGCCSLEVYNKKLAEIRSLVVRDTHQRRGIGSKLVKACMQEAKRQNIYEILSITDKISLFEKAGFHTCLNGQSALFMRP